MRARKQIAQIDGWNPAIDYRKAGKVSVIAGRNFSHDASGVKSDFGSYKMMQSSTTPQVTAQQLCVSLPKFAGVNHFLIDSKLCRFTGINNEGKVTGINETQLTNTQTMATAGYTAGDIGGYGYFVARGLGCYQASVSGSVTTVTRLWSITHSGFPDDTEKLHSCAATHGRLVVLTQSAIYWSAPGNGTSWSPTLGGAGTQLLSAIGGGTPVAMVTIDNGVAIWTTHGLIIGEFIGGPLVFRWYQKASQITPGKQTCCVQAADGRWILATQFGLYSISSAAGPEPMTPLFNEFYSKALAVGAVSDTQLFMDYPENRLFVTPPGTSRSDTFCLSLDLDRWGIFSRGHRGFGRINYRDNGVADTGLTRSDLSWFIDLDGYFHVLAQDPRFKYKRQLKSGEYVGLDSQIEIGYIREEGMVRDGNTLQELTDVTIYHSLPRKPQASQLVDSGNITDTLTSTVEPAGSMTDALADLYYEEDGDFDPETTWTLGYKLSFCSDFIQTDNITQAILGVKQASLVSAGANVDHWVESVIGHYLTIVLTAVEVGEAFNINAIDCTLAFAGQSM